ncbi:MAG: hypothetical protein OXB84_05850 [Halobacteriovoraceae bacterium]|nr:hypothetical protein [Halobacteriovoraceae bacterium]
MIYSNKVFIKAMIFFLFYGFLESSAWGRIIGFETTRLKSTSGAGVGALLLDEATVLNPAPLAFFNLSSIYFQRNKMEITNYDPALPSSPPESRHTGFILSDTSDSMKGSASYIKMQQEFNKRKRIAGSLAFASGENFAIGTTFRIIEDEISTDGISVQKKKYKQMVFGLTHLRSRNFSLGLVVIDPFKKNPLDTRILIGMQYDFADFIFFLLDLGADYNHPLSDTVLYRTALKIRILDDLLFRFGVYEDKGLKERGNSMGISWVQPRLSFDFALKNRKLLSDSTLQQSRKDIKEKSFSFSYRF